MTKLKFFIDTHDLANGTFPADMTKEGFADFYPKYEQACRELGAISLRVHLGLADGRAFCFTMAEDAETVRRAHEKVGLPFDSITEVVTATPGDMFFERA
jgi:hypothetical protein